MRFQTVAPPPVFVDTPQEIESCIRHCLTADVLGVDTETLGLLKDENGVEYHQMTDQVVVMGLSPDDDSRYLVPRQKLHHFTPLLETPNLPKALSNVKFDAHRIKNTSGATLSGPWICTVHMDFLLDEDLRENQHGLKQCAWDYLKIEMAEYTDLFGKADPREFRPGHPRWEQYLDYASLDPWATRKLAKYLTEELKRIYVWGSHAQEDLTPQERNFTLLNMYWDTEEPQLKTLWNMERRGVPVRRERLAIIGRSLQAEMDGVARELNRLVGRPINPNSGDQMGAYLFDELGLPSAGRTTTGKWKTSADVLMDLALGEHQCVEARLAVQYRQASKLSGTYAVGLDKWIHRDGRIHTSYSAAKATGRLGSSEPNLQNIPTARKDAHGIRAAFEAGAGKKLIVADYSQVEMRITAFVASTYGDFTMLNAIMGKFDLLEGDYDGIESGLDMHSFTGARMLEIPYKEFILMRKDKNHDRHAEVEATRTAAKSVGFGIIYGIGAEGLAAQLSEALKRYVSKEEAQGYIDLYLTLFPGVKAYMYDTKHMARKLGFVQTLCGRFRRLSKANSKHRPSRSHAERQAVNAPIQGSAADIVKRAMILCENDTYLRDDLGWLLLHQVHDELIFEGPEESGEEALEIIKQHMEHPFSQDLPVDLLVEGKVVTNWSEGK